MLYELYKEYTLEGKLEICRNGYHFCKDMIYVFTYYTPNKCRVFEIDTLDGDIISDVRDIKYCTNKIKLIREVFPDELNKHIKANLDKYINNPYWPVRATLANFGIGLDKLVDDDDIDVRLTVAKQGYGLNTLVDDKSWQVRREVAKQGYGLDVLINDTDREVRCAVARQGYGLDKLVYDPDWAVRVTVAEQCYGLDILIEDPNIYVRQIAKSYIKNKGDK